MVVNYASSKEGADRVVAEITGKGGKAITVQGDVSRAADVQRLFEETKQAFGALDVLVNNAGVFAFEPIEAVTAHEFHREFNVNVLGSILTIQEALKHFGSEGGSVINIGSWPNGGEVRAGNLTEGHGGTFPQSRRGFPSLPMDRKTLRDLQTTLFHQKWPRALMCASGSG